MLHFIYNAFFLQTLIKCILVKNRFQSELQDFADYQKICKKKKKERKDE